MTTPIFILSLPRSGSTFLQRVLLSSKHCATLGEPSLLLRFLGEPPYVNRFASYRENNLQVSMQDMRRKNPEFDEIYRDGVRKLMLGIYESLADGKGFFVDKTPRYTLICDEIYQTFPDAKFIVLWRHPLAVAASISSTFYNGRWRFDDFKIDLTDGLEQLHSFSTAHKASICELRYEDLVSNPNESLQKLGQYLNWPDFPDIAQIALPKSTGGTLGDPSGVKKYSKLTDESRDAWMNQYNNWYRKNWAQKYFKNERALWLQSLGYSLPPQLLSLGGISGISSGLADLIYAARKRKSHSKRIQKVFKKQNIYRYSFKQDDEITAPSETRDDLVNTPPPVAEP